MEEQKNENVEKVNSEVKAEVKTEKGKKSKKGLIIAIIAVILVIIVGISLFVAYHSSQLALLTEEINEMSLENLLNEDGTINENAKIDMEIKTKGSYAVVEQTSKEYINEVLELGKGLINVINDKNIQDLVDFENIKNDAPDFVQTKDKIAKMKKAGEEYVDKFLELCDRENVLSAIDDKGVSEYYKELYKRLATDDVADEEFDEAAQKLGKAREQKKKGFEYIENMINFLSEHKSDWKIVGNQIMFYNQSVLDQYQELVSNVPEEIK